MSSSDDELTHVLQIDPAMLQGHDYARVWRLLCSEEPLCVNGASLACVKL